MNEFQVIDSVMPDVPPPSADRLQEARERVLAAGQAPPVSTAGGRSWALVAAAVVLVVGAVVALVPRPAVEPASPVRKLEAAAARLAATPEPQGRYWQRDTEHVLRTKNGHGYPVEERGIEVLAFGPDRDIYAWYEPVSSKPYTAEGLKAWRKDGSPRLCPARGCDKNLPVYNSGDLDVGLELADGLKPTMTQLRNLPREPAALRAWLVESYPEQTPSTFEPWLQAALKQLIVSPATPGTRAAAYLVLAKEPDVKVVDGVPGTFGLDGLALQTRDVQIVIDRTNGRLLGRQRLTPEGVAYSAELVMKAGWSDARPTLPARCVRCTARF